MNSGESMEATAVRTSESSALAAEPALRLTRGEAIRKPKSRPATPRVQKPSEDFPLTRHRNGQWCKKIRGKQYFFGVHAFPWEALELYLRLRPFLEAGRSMAQARADAAAAPSIAARDRAICGSGEISRPMVGQAVPDVLLRDLCEQFLAERQRDVEANKLDARSFAAYHHAFTLMLRTLNPNLPVRNLRPADFSLLHDALCLGASPNVSTGRIGRIRSLFNWGAEMGHIDRTPHYGRSFKKPKAWEIRAARANRGRQHFEAAEIRALLNAASPQLKAMILLGINCGFGNTDLAMLTRSVVNLDTGFVCFPRPKTGVWRRAALWPETIEQLRLVERIRPAPINPADADLVFITRHGRPWVRCSELRPSKTRKFSVGTCDSICQEFEKLRAELGIKDQTAKSKGGLAFYALRRTFRTVAERTLEERAIRTIMGHSAAGRDIAEHYLKGPEEECLQRVAACVRNWLFGTATATPDSTT